MYALTTAEITPERHHAAVAIGGRYVGQILREAPIFDAQVTCGGLATLFASESPPQALVIQTAAGVYGLVDRLTFLPRYLERFNRDLFQRKPITALMDSQPLVVEWSTPIDRVGMLAADASGNSVRSAFVIVRD